MTKIDFCGWRNKSTWNIALWINNDPILYMAAIEFMMSKVANMQQCNLFIYRLFIHSMNLQHDRTPDRIKWLSNRLDHLALNEMMVELGDLK